MAQLVARLLWEQEVVSSSLTGPTIKKLLRDTEEFFVERATGIETGAAGDHDRTGADFPLRNAHARGQAKLTNERGSI